MRSQIVIRNINNDIYMYILIYTSIIYILKIYIYIYFSRLTVYREACNITCFIREILFQRKSNLYLSRVINSFFLQAKLEDFLSSGNSSKDPSGGGFTKSVKRFQLLVLR